MAITEFGRTHYRWRDDVERLVRMFLRRHRASANTYEDHPTGMNLDDVSVDFWGVGGRGIPITPSVGDSIFRRLRKRKRPPSYRWIIWRGWIHYPTGVRRRYKDPDDPHFDHVHVTFW